MTRTLSRYEMVERVRNCFLGIQIGDALGMPVEMMTREEILKVTDGKGVTGYIEPVQRRIHDTMNLKAGQTTDDWFLTSMVAESIMEARGFDCVNMARWHVHAYDISVFGWGGTTKTAIEAFKAYFEGKPGGRHPEVPAPDIGLKKGLGNGVAMKIAPLALWHAIRQEQFEIEPFLSDAIALGRMTHSHLDATVAACALGAVIGHAFRNQARDEADLDVTFNRMCDVIGQATFRLQHVGDSEFVDRLLPIVNDVPDICDLAEKTGTGCNSLESVPLAIGTFLRHPNDIRAALIYAVNAGGDTDTIASMVGAMCGANLEVKAGVSIPAAWIDGLVDRGAEACKLAERFVDAALR